MSASSSAAAVILQRAVELDERRQFGEALICYQEGIQLLINNIKDETNAETRSYLTSKAHNYMARAEELKKTVKEKKEEPKHEQILIEEGSSGHSYQSVFGRFLDNNVTWVQIEDPYIRSHHQCQNFLRFCELLVKTCSDLKTITLVTSTGTDSGNQAEWLQSIQTDLQKYKVELKLNFSPTLHDRQIKLSNDWTIKLGRGLDYFKKTDGKFSLGVFDCDLRKCHQTAIDAFRTKDVRQTYG